MDLTVLYFTADERPRLVETPGRTVPCTHWRCPLAFPAVPPAAEGR